MSLNTLVEKELISCNPSTPIREVAGLMENHAIGAIVVLDGGRPCGIVTDRDIVVRCVVEGKDCASTPVHEIMTEDVDTVSVNDGIFDVIQLMKRNEVRRVPVVDEKGKCVGLISFGDLFALLTTELADLAGPATPEKPKIVDKAA